MHNIPYVQLNVNSKYNKKTEKYYGIITGPRRGGGTRRAGRNTPLTGPAASFIIYADHKHRRDPVSIFSRRATIRATITEGGILLKKTTAILLALAMALCCCAAWAEDGAKPILFRGIPWGVSYTELSAQLSLSTPTVKDNRYTAYFTDGETVAGDETPFMMYSALKSAGLDAIGSVAGYRVDHVTLYFIRTADESGSIVKDQDHTAFCAAVYILGKPVSPNLSLTDRQIHEDLTAKLTGLYGEPDQSHINLVWHGAEGTLLAMNENNTLYYVCGNLDASIRALLEIEKAELEAFSTDTTGL